MTEDRRDASGTGRVASGARDEESPTSVDRARGDGAVVRAGAVLGLGVGAFFDGIVFHQLLQTHHLLSAHPDPEVASDLRLNVLADGLFHVLAYVLVLAGLGLLWRAWRRTERPRPPSRLLAGAVLAGWGLFNLLEGAVNHHLLDLHHVWPDGPGGRLVWDLAFLAWGAGFLIVGVLLVRGVRRSAARDRR